jgi:hypothetical protein
MASTGSSRPGDPPGGRRKRPAPPTIDLKAETVKAEPVADPAPATPPEPPPEAFVPPAESVPHHDLGRAEAPPTNEPAAPLSAAERIEAALPPSAPEPPPAPEPAPAAPPIAEAPPPSPPPPRDDARATLGRHWGWPPTRPALAAAAAVFFLFALTATWIATSGDPRDDEWKALAARVATAESQLRTLAERPVPASTDPRQVAELATRIAAAEETVRRLAPLAAQPPAPDLGPRLDALIARIAKLESAPPPAPDAALRGRLDATEQAARRLAERLATAEAQLTSIAAEAGAVRKDAATLAERLGLVETTVKAFGDRIGDLGKGVDQAAAAALKADRQAVLASEEAAQTRTEQEADKALRLAVVAAALREHTSRGTPFAAELSAAKPLADPELLKPLEPFAASGVPTASALARDLAGITPAMRALLPSRERDGSLGERLQRSAERLVRVRPVNAPPGDDPEAVIARVDAKAAQADVDGARSELAKLPADLRAPANGWISRVEARAAALAAAERLSLQALASLGISENRPR